MLKNVFKTTFAVFLPTPGSFTRASLSAGTSPLNFSSRILLNKKIFFDLVLNSPILLINFFILLCPKFTIACGVSASLKSFLVTPLTPLSVDWAERTTATSSVKTDEYSSSVCGFGFLIFRTLNILLILFFILIIKL